MDKAKLITILTAIGAVIASIIAVLQSNTAVDTAQRTEAAVEQGVSPSLVVTPSTVAQ